MANKSQSEQARRKNIRIRASLLAFIDYGINIALLVFFFLFGKIPLDVVIKISIATIALNALFLGLFYFEFNRFCKDPSLTGIQVLSGCGINFVGLFLAPQIGYMFLINLFIPLAYGSLHFKQATFLVAWALTSAAVAMVVYLPYAHTSFILNSSIDKTLFVVTYATALARFLFINAEVSRLRVRLSMKNRALKNTSNKLKDLVAKDELTGISNRRNFFKALSTMENAQPKQKLFIALIDIDHFKRVNDTHGHMVGDRVICCVASALKEVLRSKEDCVARFGGEEYAILLASQDLDNAIKAFERTRQHIADMDWQSEGVSFQITISIGVTCWTDNEAPRQVLKRADEALYMAKSRGRNQVVFYDKPTQAN